jgi:hypothetical protein
MELRNFWWDMDVYRGKSIKGHSDLSLEQGRVPAILVGHQCRT